MESLYFIIFCSQPDSYSLVYSLPVLSVPTHYSDISSHANSVIDLIFLSISYTQVIHFIEPNLKQLLNHASLIVNLPITLENIQVHRKFLKQNSNEEVAFLLSVSKRLSQLDFSSLNSIASLDLLSEMIFGLFADCQTTYTKRITVTSHSKE